MYASRRNLRVREMLVSETLAENSLHVEQFDFLLTMTGSQNIGAGLSGR